MEVRERRGKGTLIQLGMSEKLNFDEALEVALDYAFLFYNDRQDIIQVTKDKLIDNIGRENKELTVEEADKVRRKVEKYLGKQKK